MTTANLTYRQAEALRNKLNKQGVWDVDINGYEKPVRGGSRRVTKYRVDYRANPARRTAKRKTARRKNAPKSQSKWLKNFTGVVKRMSDGTVQIIGTGRKPNPSKKRATKKRRVARGKR